MPGATTAFDRRDLFIYQLKGIKLSYSLVNNHFVE